MKVLEVRQLYEDARNRWYEMDCETRWFKRRVTFVLNSWKDQWGYWNDQWSRPNGTAVCYEDERRQLTTLMQVFCVRKTGQSELVTK